VTGDVISTAEGRNECSDLPGITEAQFAETSDLPPEALAGSFYWTVEGRSEADAVAKCFESVGAVDVTVRRA
jgi:hypothetical protein